jgi:4-phytase/acid phosphatase
MRVHFVSAYLRSSLVSQVLRLVFGAASLAVVSGGPTLAAAPVLERVIVVERHGVRSPTDDPKKLFDYSSRPWPSWPVGTGELTDHGFAGVANIGRALRRHYAKLGLLTAHPGCDNAIFIWSDGKYTRTIRSGEAVGLGLNACKARIGHGPENETDPLFDPVGAKVCRVVVRDEIASVAPRLKSTLEANAAAYALARTTLQSILTPGWKDCVLNPKRKECLIAGGDTTLLPDGSLTGPLALGSTLSENLLLEYGQGMPAAAVGWGMAPAQLATVMPLHNLFSIVMRSDPYLASRRGSALMQEILDALSGVPSTFKGAVPIPKDARFVLFLGHDTNLSNLGGLLGRQWSLPGEPDATGPAAVMAFELWRTDQGPQVAIRMAYPTLGQLRTLAAVNPLPAVPLPVTCQNGQPCSPAGLKAKLGPALAQECLKPQ